MIPAYPSLCSGSRSWRARHLGTPKRMLWTELAKAGPWGLVGVAAPTKTMLVVGQGGAWISIEAVPREKDSGVVAMAVAGSRDAQVAKAYSTGVCFNILEGSGLCQGLCRRSCQFLYSMIYESLSTPWNNTMIGVFVGN